MLWQKILLLSKICIYIMNTIKRNACLWTWECLSPIFWTIAAKTMVHQWNNCGDSHPNQSECDHLFKSLSSKPSQSFYLGKQVHKDLCRAIGSERFLIDWSHVTTNKKTPQHLSSRFYREVNQGENDCSNALPEESMQYLQDDNIKKKCTAKNIFSY